MFRHHSNTAPSPPRSGLFEADADWRRSNIGHLLFASSDRFLREKLASMQAAGFDIGEAQLALLITLDPEGTRPGEIGKRMNLTKASVSELTVRSERAGLIARTVDPVDNRARLIALTLRGELAQKAIHRAVERAEAGFFAQTGKHLAQRFRLDFGAYAADHDDLHRSPQWHSANVGRVLALAARGFVSEVLNIVHGNGHRGVGEALLSLIRNLELGGTRLTDLATRAHMTKQSMRELVDRSEMLGIVQRAPDAGDKRAKLVRFTPAGQAMLEDMRGAVAAAEARLADRVGAEFLSEVRTALRDYAGVTTRVSEV